MKHNHVKGKFLLIDVREFYHKDGEKMPGKKGIALKQDQYNKIKVQLKL